MNTNEKPTDAIGMDEQPSDDEKKRPAAGELPEPNAPRPYCRTHWCLMDPTGTHDGIRRFACPVPACKETGKEIKQQTAVPRAPHSCPKCHARDIQEPKRGGKNKPAPARTFLEVDPERGTQLHVMLMCPRCGFAIPVPRLSPDDVQRTNRRRHADVMDI